MYYRSYATNQPSPAPRKPSFSRRPFSYRKLWFGLFTAIICSVIARHIFAGSPDVTTPTFHAGVQGICLDAHHSSTTANSLIDGWGCNGSSAQTWTRQSTHIVHAGLCLGTSDNGTHIVQKACGDIADEIWLPTGAALYNPTNQKCLSLTSTHSGVLTLSACDASQLGQQWVGRYQPAQSCDNLKDGTRIVCTAVQQWVAWHAADANHSALLTAYTDGTSYEAWCADFISYVYKIAGYPFMNGSSDGWDQNTADNLQYMGFTVHDASGYTPQPGDVAYFDYPGGHAEIVIGGSSAPVFLYGNSASIDPTTGNGQMESNPITSRPTGQLMYYLSPVL